MFDFDLIKGIHEMEKPSCFPYQIFFIEDDGENIENIIYVYVQRYIYYI